MVKSKIPKVKKALKIPSNVGLFNSFITNSVKIVEEVKIVVKEEKEVEIREIKKQTKQPKNQLKKFEFPIISNKYSKIQTQIILDEEIEEEIKEINKFDEINKNSPTCPKCSNFINCFGWSKKYFLLILLILLETFHFITKLLQNLILFLLILWINFVCFILVMN